MSNLMKRLSQFVPAALALALVALLVVVGQRSGWRLSKFSELRGGQSLTEAAWCDAHSVLDSVCVECSPDILPRGKDFGWCKVHGIHDCPLCHPEVAQLVSVPSITAEDRRRTDATLESFASSENNSKCQLHLRRIQLTSAAALKNLGIGVEVVEQTPIRETIAAAGEIGFDPTRVARVAARAAGVLLRIDRRIGDKVRAGDLLAIVDSAEVGQAKAAFQQALVQLELKTQNLARRKALEGQAVAARSVQDAEAEAADSQVRLLAARQTLLNYGLAIPLAEFQKSEPAEVARRLQFLGLPTELKAEIELQTSSNSLVAVRAPFDGEVIDREAVPGEAVDASQVLLVIADTRRMWLTLNVAIEHADRVRAGQRVQFQHSGHDDCDEGTVSWVGLAVDESTRTVPVLVELANSAGAHQARSFGQAKVFLREEPRAVVVPTSAVHWEGDCHVVFVRDKDFDREGTPKIFHVRKVRPGVEELAHGGPMTEVIAGLLPGEMIATTNSGILRSELLRNSLGEG